jgi:ribosome biogenesis GTPase
VHDPEPLRALGWDDVLAAALPPEATPARVSRADRGGILTVEGADGTLRARLGPRRRGDEPVVVGDWVALGADRVDGDPLVVGVLPRRGVLVRQAPEDRGATTQTLAANVDVTLITAGLDQPVNQRRLDRFLTLAWQGGTTPVVVLTKADRAEDPDGTAAEVAAATLGADVIAVSAVTGEGLDALAAHLQPGRTAVLVGPSGTGKSTLANRLLGGAVLATGAIRDDGRGRHTTTARQLLRLDSGALLVDTPGIRELALWDADEGLGETFADVEELAAGCRFADCAHDTEPGCAVRAALEDGSLAADRVESYQKLQRELAHAARKQDVLLRKEQQRRWKQIHMDLRRNPKPRD